VLNVQQLALKLSGLCTMLLLLWVAWLIWQNDSVTQKVRNYEVVIDSPQALKSLPPLITEPLRQALYQASIEVGGNNQFMAKVADEYVKRRPLDAQGWLWGSLFYQRDGDLKTAAKYLSIAHRLSVKNTPQLVQVFNRYLELGLVEQAMPVARNLSFSQPAQFRKAFYLMTRLSDNYKAVVDEVIPKTVPNVRPGRKPHKPSLYYKWALNDSIRADNYELAEAVWNAIPVKLRINSDYGLAYINYLATGQNYSHLATVWLEHTGRELPLGRLPEQNFDADLTEYSPCWRIVPVKDEHALMSASGDHDNPSLTLQFAGQDNLHYYHSSCIFAVESGQEYSLSGRWQGLDITTLSGPYVEVFSPGVKGFRKQIAAQIGNWVWSEFDLNFTAPDGVKILSVRIRRSKTDYLDSKISGTVNFKDFKVTANENSAKVEGQ